MRERGWGRGEVLVGKLKKWLSVVCSPQALLSLPPWSVSGSSPCDGSPTPAHTPGGHCSWPISEGHIWTGPHSRCLHPCGVMYWGGGERGMLRRDHQTGGGAHLMVEGWLLAAA